LFPYFPLQNSTKMQRHALWFLAGMAALCKHVLP
jgi:hypothetical protein